MYGQTDGRMSAWLLCGVQIRGGKNERVFNSKADNSGTAFSEMLCMLWGFFARDEKKYSISIFTPCSLSVLLHARFIVAY